MHGQAGVSSGSYLTAVTMFCKSSGDFGCCCLGCCISTCTQTHCCAVLIAHIKALCYHGLTNSSHARQSCCKDMVAATLAGKGKQHKGGRAHGQCGLPTASLLADLYAGLLQMGVAVGLNARAILAGALRAIGRWPHTGANTAHTVQGVQSLQSANMHTAVEAPHLNSMPLTPG